MYGGGDKTNLHEDIDGQTITLNHDVSWTNADIVKWKAKGSDYHLFPESSKKGND